MKTMLQRIFFLRLLLPQAAGIAIGNLFPTPLVWQLCLATGAALSLVTVLYSSPYAAYTLRWTRGLGVMLVFFAVGNVSMQMQTEATCVVLSSQKEPCSFRLIEQQQTASGRTRWLIEPLHPSARAYLYLSSSSAPLASIGSIYKANIAFRPIDNHSNTGRFDYALWCFRQGITHVGFAGRNDSICQTHPLLWGQLLRSPELVGRVCRNRCVSFFRSLPMGREEQSVVTGLTLGDKQAMTGEVKERFRQLGISHLLAVSGLHVGILFGILFWMFKPVERSRRGRWLRYALPVAMLWGYAAITGFTPSVVRATLMCSLYTVGLAVERQNTAAHTLTVTAFLLLLYRPSYLFDVGFQLSFAAVAFILLAVHLRRLWWPDLQGWKRWIADFVTVSTAAQIGTLPLTLYYFGSFQPLFLLSNLAAIPLVPFIMLFALATGALAFVGLEFAFPLFLLHSSLKLLTLTTHLGERWLGRAQITLLFDGCDLLFAYLFLGCLAIFFAFRLRKGAIAALGVALGWSLSHL